ncbi:putative ubiquitin-conjugating enzyme E2 26 [Bienertia sinuspersici]
MENPTIQLPPENSKKRMFAGSSSSSFPEPDLIEIPPPASWKSKPQRKKSIVDCELIVLDSEEPDDVVIIDEKIAPNAKGKKPMHDYFSADKAPSKDGAHFTSMKDCMQGGSSSHVSFIDDDFDFDVMDLSKNLYDSDCEMLQAHFDAVDIPSGVEATVPWWPFSSGLGEQSVAASGSTAQYLSGFMKRG